MKVELSDLALFLKIYLKIPSVSRENVNGVFDGILREEKNVYITHALSSEWSLREKNTSQPMNLGKVKR